MKKALLYGFIFSVISYFSASQHQAIAQITVSPVNLYFDTSCQGDAKQATVEIFLDSGYADFQITSVSFKNGTKFTHGFTGTDTVKNDSFTFFQVQANTSATGTYTDTLRIYHNSSLRASPINISARIIVFSVPSADFNLTTTDSQCLNTNSFAFSNNSTPTTGLKYIWDYGDGVTDTVKTPTHVYKTAGDYVISLTVRNAGNCQSDIVAAVTVNPLPSFNIALNDSTQCLNTNAVVIKNFTSITSGSIVDKQWDLGDGTTTANVDSIYHVYSTDSSYFRIQLIATTNKNCVDTGYARAYIMPVPDALYAVNDSDQCVNANTYVFTNQTTLKKGTMTYSWSFGDGDTSTQKDPTKVYNSAGFKATYLAAISDSGCVDTFKSGVNVFFKPNSFFTVDDTIKCSNKGAFIFTNGTTIGSLDNVSSYWFFGDSTGSVSTSPNYTYPAAGVYTVKLISSSDKGCNDTFTRRLESLPAPASNFTINDPTQCFIGHSFRFTYQGTIATGSTITDYKWFLGENDSTTIQDPVKNNYATEDTFYVKLYTRGDNGCVDTNTQMIIVLPEPHAGITVNDSTQCFVGNFFDFTDKTTIKWGSLTHYWDPGDGGFSTSPSVSTSYTVYQPTYNILHVVTSDGGCIDTVYQRVYLDPGPNVSFTVNDDEQCKRGNQFNFTNNTTLPASYENEWKFGNGDSSAQLNPSYSFASAGVYNVLLTVKNLNTGCEDTMYRQVIVNALPGAFFVVDRKNQCFDGNLFNFTNLTTEPIGNTTKYTWDFDDGSPNDTLKNTSHTYAIPSLYGVSLYAVTDKGCDSTYIDSALVRPMPVAAFSINDQFQCINTNNYVFTDNSSVAYGGLTYAWNFGEGGSSTLQNPTYSYFLADSFGVTLIVTSDYNCTDTARDYVKIYQKPFANFVIRPRTEQCLDGNRFLFINSSSITAASATYTFDLGDGNTFVSNTFVNDTAKHTYSTYDTFPVIMYIETDEGCRDTMMRNVVVFATPVAAFSINDTLQCNDIDTFVFTNNSSVDGGINLNFEWDFGDFNGSIDSNVTHSYRRANDYTVSLIVYTDEGCADTVTHNVRVTPSPTATFTGLSDQYCIGSGPVTLSPTIPGGAFTGNNISDSTFNPIQLGMNFITYAIDVDGCSDTLTDSTLVVGPLNIDLGSDTIICKDDILFFNLSSPGATIQWSTGETGPLGTINTSGNHSVIVTNACGVYTDDINVEAVDYFCDAFTPNSFTPDGNLINDYFFPFLDTSIVKDFEFIVFNRWGNIVYRTSDFKSLGWDGKFNGAESPQDVYGWYLRMGVVRGEIRNLRTDKGSVLLLR